MSRSWQWDSSSDVRRVTQAKLRHRRPLGRPYVGSKLAGRRMNFRRWLANGLRPWVSMTKDLHVRRRVPHHEVEDVLQSVYCDALSAQRVPEQRDELSKWLVGI